MSSDAMVDRRSGDGIRPLTYKANRKKRGTGVAARPPFFISFFR